MFAPWRTEQRQRCLPRQLLQAVRSLVEVSAVFFSAPAQVLARLRTAAGADAKTALRLIAAPIGMVVGVAGKFMPFFGARAPPSSPVLAERAVAFAGFFVGCKKGDRSEEHTSELQSHHEL